MTLIDGVVSFTVGLVLTVVGAADVACTESSRDYRDGACVLEVVRGRAASGWARYDGSLLGALFEPNQHAHGCRHGITLKHLELGARFAVDALNAEPFCRLATHYRGDYDPEAMCATWGVEPIGRLAHVYCAPALRAGR